MYEQIQIKKLKPSGRHLFDRSPSRHGRLCATLALALAWIVVSPAARAVTPAPDGGYPNFNTAEGEDALFSLTTGFENAAVGAHALYRNSTGSFNTALGAFALANGAAGNDNTAIGYDALTGNTTGISNTAVGAVALRSNDTGGANTATGVDALAANRAGNNNTANGAGALFFAYGSNNTAIGAGAMTGNIDDSIPLTGVNNTAVGNGALANDSTGNYNAASGQGALYSNTTGSNNTGDGQNALRSNTTGENNIALGSRAGFKLTTGSNNIDIGNGGVAAEAGTIRLGNKKKQTSTYVAGISGVTVAGGMEVIVDSNGHLGTVTSSARYKENIQPMDKTSEAILSLKPVSFHYKHELDPQGIPQFGLVAEQVAKVNPDLVARDDQGKPYTVRYEAVNAMLLNEFLKEHRKVEAQDTRIAQLEGALAKMQATMEKVSDQLAASQTASPRLVNSR